MCGITGVFDPSGRNGEPVEARAARMTAAIVHRGPDDDGTWADEAAGIALGFRRLAIIDLSPAGHQPMRSTSGRFTLVFNGEVYNHRALRAELEAAGHGFRGHSDTEVMLAAFEQWGVREAVPRFLGMYAFAVWDARERELVLGRDRLGKKPLYYHRGPAGLLFGSELKALCADPAFPRRVDTEALGLYFRYLCVPAPRTIFRDTHQLPPAHLLVIRDPRAPLPAPEPYWRLDEAFRRGRSEPFPGDDAEMVAELERRLRDAVRLRLEADVPLGALLSGGIDSSTVVALMQAEASQPVRTYSIGFDVAEHDEAKHAAAVANHLGTRHTLLRVSGQEALDVVPRLPDLFDEPFADPSAIPTYLVCGLARREVTVALTGDGGDELFGGYNRYLHGARMLRTAGRLPAPLRLAAAAGLRGVGVETWNRLYRGAAAVLPGTARQRLPGEKAHKLGDLLAQEGDALRYRALQSAWQVPASLLRVPFADDPAAWPFPEAVGGGALEERMMLADQGHYLPDELLAKVDRASMAVSLEARVPLLDHRLVEWSWRLPLRAKLRDGTGKWVLREVLYRHVPRALVDRPKTGFTVPIGDWLRGPLAAWAGDLLGGVLAGQDPLLAAAPVAEAWDALRGGRRASGLALWTVLTWLAWRERWRAAA